MQTVFEITLWLEDEMSILDVISTYAVPRIGDTIKIFQATKETKWTVVDVCWSCVSGEEYPGGAYADEKLDITVKPKT